MADEPATVKGKILRDPHMFPNAKPAEEGKAVAIGDEVEVSERDALALSMAGLIQLPDGWKPGQPQTDAGVTLIDGAEETKPAQSKAKSAQKGAE